MQQQHHMQQMHLRAQRPPVQQFTQWASVNAPPGQMEMHAKGPETVRASDLARAASASRHDGDVTNGSIWWAVARNMLRRLYAPALAVAEQENQPFICQYVYEINALIYEFCLASLGESDACKALSRRIQQRKPIIIDDGWATRRLMCNMGETVSGIEADALLADIAKFKILVTDSKAEEYFQSGTRSSRRWHSCQPTAAATRSD